MTASNFARSVLMEKSYEGGFVNLAKDPGGATNFGITEFALSAHRGHKCTVQDVKNLEWSEAEAIYHSTYWPGVKADDLPAGVDLVVFDAAINCGRGRAITFLQAAVGEKQDGVLGDVTMSRVHNGSAVTIVGKLKVARASYYRALKTFDTFGEGWMNRLSNVVNTGLRWAIPS